MDAAEDGGPGVRGRSDLGGRLVHRRQRGDERRRQEGGAVGHGDRQPGLVAHGDAAGRVARGRAARAQPRQDPRRAERAVPAAVSRAARSCSGKSVLEIPGLALPQGGPGQGRERQVPRRAARASRRRAPTASSSRRASSCTACRRTRAPCAWSSSAWRAKRCRPSSRSRTTSKSQQAVLLAGPGAPGRALREGGRLRHQVAPQRAPAHGADRRPGRRRRRRGGGGGLGGGAHRQRARRRRLRRGLARGAQALLARPRAHRGDRQAHQRLQDQRGRGDPARAARRVHRRRRAHQHRVLGRATSSSCWTRWRSISPANWRSRTRTLLGERPGPRARAAAPRARRAGRRSPRDLDHYFDRAAVLRAAAVVEDRGARRAAPHLRRRRVPPRSSKAPRRCTSGCCAGRVFVALHMHAGDGNVHTNIPVNSDDYEMLQRASDAVARIMRLARSLGGVISGEHGIGITKLEFLEPGRDRGVPRLQAGGRSRRAASTPASCSPAATSPTPTRRASR